MDPTLDVDISMCHSILTGILTIHYTECQDDMHPALGTVRQPVGT